MNAVQRSVLPQSRRSKGLTAHSRVTQPKVAPSSSVTSMPSRTAAQKVEKLNVSQQPKPIWLSSLLVLQRGSDVMAFFLVATTLTIYSWTVYTQQQWTQEYRKLETLQRQERQLTTANAVMKDQLAQQAERPATGLVTPSQANTIYLPSAPQRPFDASATRSADPEPSGKTPLGY